MLKDKQSTNNSWYDQKRKSLTGTDYVPPDIMFSPSSNQSARITGRLNYTEYDHRYSSGADPSMTRSSLLNVEFTELPIVNMFDLTKQSSNYIKCKKGEVKHPDDLECNIIVDDKLAQEDLHVIE